MALNAVTSFADLSPQQKIVARERAKEVLKEARAKKTAILQALPLFQLELERRQMRVFKNFVFKFWHVVEPDRELKWNWHLDVLCYDAELLYKGEILQEIINVPPGTMKSLLMSVLFRAWMWSLNPKFRFLAGSYGSKLSVEHNIKLRDIVTSAEFKRLWPKFALTEEGKERFDTVDGGWSIATSVGGIGTGEHPDFNIIDDPVTEAEARSAAERTTANNWIDRTLSTRGVSRGARTLVIMQRFDPDDPTGHLLQQGGWYHRCFPMEYVPLREATATRPGFTPDPADVRTTPGELLWPSLFPRESLIPVYLRLGPYGIAGQMQQQPSPEGGGLFKREWLKFVEAAPKVARRARGWDTGGGGEGSDPTASCKIAEKKDQFFIEHATNDVLSPAGVDAIMKQLAWADGKETVIRELTEPASSGKTVIAARTKLLKGFDHSGHRVTGDKVTEARPLRAQCEAGNVFIVQTGDAARDAWIEPFIQELCDFKPGCRYDNQVDAASCAFNSVLLEPEPQEEFAVW